MERREALKGIGVLGTLLIAPTMVFGDKVDEFVYLHYKPVNDDVKLVGYGGVIIYSKETYNKLLYNCGSDNDIDTFIRYLDEDIRVSYSFLTKDEYNKLDKLNYHITYNNFCPKNNNFLSTKEIQK